MKYEDRNHTGRPPNSDDFFRVVPWTAYPDNRMGPHPSGWLMAAINEEARFTVENEFVFPGIFDLPSDTSNSSNSTVNSSNKKRK